jgi:hypothetical protein
VAVPVGVLLFAPQTVTLDGYSHLYHARLLRDLLAGLPETVAYFTWASPLLPNWLTALTLAALSSILPATLALKLLVIAAFLALLGGLAAAARAAASLERLPPQSRLLLTPFALCGFLTMGFLGYLLSAALAFYVLSLLLHPRFAESWPKQTLAAFLLLVAYFFNPFPVLIALLFPLASLTLDPRALWPFAPVACLMAGFYMTLSAGGTAQSLPLARLVIDRALSLAKPDSLAGLASTPTAVVAFALLLGVLLAGLFLSKPSGPLAILFGCTFLAYFVAPDAVGDASLISKRLLMFALSFLVLLALARGPLDRRLAMLCALLATATIGLFSAEYLLVSIRLKPAADELAQALQQVPRGSTVLFLGYPLSPSCQDWGLAGRIAPERHWPMLAALERGLIVLNDYQPGATHFPVQYRDKRFAGVEDELKPASTHRREAWRAVLTTPNPEPAYLVAWGAPPALLSDCTEFLDPPLADLFPARFDPVFERRGASYVAIWRNRGAQR